MTSRSWGGGSVATAPSICHSQRVVSVLMVASWLLELRPSGLPCKWKKGQGWEQSTMRGASESGPTQQLLLLFPWLDLVPWPSGKEAGLMKYQVQGMFPCMKEVERGYLMLCV